jgi:hypothetical protein
MITGLRAKDLTVEEVGKFLNKNVHSLRAVSRIISKFIK